MGQTLAASMGRQNGRTVRKMERRTVRRMEDSEEDGEEDGEENSEEDSEEDGERQRGQSGAGRMERDNRTAGGSQTSKRETRALRQTGGGMRKEENKEMQAREEGARPLPGG